MSFELFIGLSSAVITAVTTVIAGLVFIGNRAESELQRATLERIHVDAVLGEATLKSVGDLIVRDLGSTSMPDYVRDTEIRVRFRHAFNAARGFLGEPLEEASDNDTNTEPPWQSSEPHWADTGFTADGLRALRDIGNGEAWNALARMRRILEQELFALLNSESIESVTSAGRPTRGGAGQLVVVAERAGLVSENEARRLRHSIGTANRAIHGEDVPADEAVDAVVSIDRFIQRRRGPAVD
ncbi:hypothetical protein [Leifsonia virtsii]|uniref:DUF4145 domain-containing protein n=1 Tax=Leifsonia virtsii TaxID=3035915 RepID=A0ABT8IV94_9MICO|nr:hypothetical protein [Leifsonia virtsii]MDN4596710.1 hypothetical protein [Leifsonia virtsii]